ncbi:similar to Saccharomyces cerevisiae YMR308C PSE1 Karyopherin/importin that interacts with the nuclear pore complex [Geotrichum candidum]|uniref:Similar to Saccharomyces cerevisiae YMR308C PSE1 Karyopherin/importin that interacts with the nuclear pore complex n=1 Tax=Geotrichum candidum TaxID=1173061 RepID=A0A0J9XCL9_GEOCN|nr:similar to Saccharomyces cerevisiae YMR308C PSE1 Karyopherin/importin that interacts with the nuclear pore complex [Geotrichum candidum]
MSVLPADVLSSLSLLLENLISPNNDTRTLAEKELNDTWITGGETQRSYLLVGLSEQSVLATHPTTRSFAAVLFRRVAIRSPENSDDVTNRILDVLSDDVLAQIRQIFLTGLTSDQPSDVRHKIADAISELAKPGPKAVWVELLPALFNASKSSNESIRESAFRIFSTTPAIVSLEMIPALGPVFESGFGDSSEKVRIAALDAFAAFFRVLPKKAWKELQHLLPNLLNVLTPFKQENKGDELASVFESVIELAEMAPKMFKPHLNIILQFCVEVAQNKETEDTARMSALELLSTLVDEAPNMCKKEPEFAEKLIYTCLTMMTEVGEDDEDGSIWTSQDDLSNADEDEEIYSASKHSLDRLALKLGGEVVLPKLFLWLPQLASSTQWRERHAALMALSNVAEGCASVMIPEINSIIDLIWPRIEDEHPRVQWAAINALGQMSTDFADDIQTKHSERVIPAIISRMHAGLNPRVQAHAAAAMVNFSENATKEILEPYLNELLQQLLNLLQSPHKYVNEQALTTIAIVADAAQNKFVQYYDTLMPLLVNVMQSESTKEYRILKAKSIECCSLIASAVGREKAAPDFDKIVKIFASIQSSVTDPDDPCLAYLGQAWGRLAQVMGKDFIPCLDLVMPPLLQAAKAKPDLQLIEDEAEVEAFEQQEGWEVLPLQGKYIGMHTAALEEKSNAIDIIGIYASVLGEDFYPYAKEVVTDIIVPGLNFFYQDNVRYSTLQIVPSIISCVQKAVLKGKNTTPDAAKRDPAVLEVFTLIFDRLIDLLSIEPLVEILVSAYVCVFQCIELMFPGVLTKVHTEKLSIAIENSIKDYAERLAIRQSGDDQYTEDVSEEDEEIDEELIEEICKTIHAIFKSSRVEFFPEFQARLLPIVTSFLAGNSGQINWALCVIDDFIEFTGPQSWTLKDAFLPRLVDCLVSGDSSIRQAAAYGIGVAAQHGGPNYAEVCLGTLENLFNIVNVPEARSEDNVHATENVCTAIAKILRIYGAQLGGNLDQALTAWVKTLPIINDDEAAPFAYQFLSDLMDQNHEAVLSQAPKVIESVALALKHSSVQGQTAKRVVEATKAFVSRLPNDHAMQIIQSLPAEEQAVLQKAFEA